METGSRGRIYAKMFHVKHRGARRALLSEWRRRKRFHVKHRRRAMFHVKHFCVKKSAIAGPENTILQNNPMHQKIVEQNQ